MGVQSQMSTLSTVGSSKDARWLFLARAVWVGIAVLGFGLFSLNVPRHLAELSTPSAGIDPILQYYMPTLEDEKILSQVGLDLNFYSIYILTFEVLWILFFLLPAAIIIWRRPTDRMALFVSFTFLTYGFFGTPLMYSAIETHLAWRLLIILLASAGVTGLCVFWFLFPDGRFVPRWARTVTIIFAPSSTLWFYLYTFFPVFESITFVIVGIPIFMGCLIAATIAQAYRYFFVSNPVQRQQTKWVLFGVFSMTLGMSLNVLLIIFNPTLLTSSSRIIFLIYSTPFTLFSITLVPLSITLSIFRYRLWEIDFLIRRTLTYTALTGVLVFTYFSSVTLLQGLFRLLARQESNQIVTIVSTLTIAAAFNPLRRRIQNWIDRRFYRRHYDASLILETFNFKLKDEVDLDQLQSDLLAVVEETIQPETLSLWLKPTGGRREDLVGL
jgi:hypothetical protein